MSKFFNEKNPLAGFEEFLATQKISKISDTQEIKKYDQGKIYTFLETNFFRLKKIITFMHKNILNLESRAIYDFYGPKYKSEIYDKKKIILEKLLTDNSVFQKKMEDIYDHFFV